MTSRLVEISDWLTELFPNGAINSLKYIESDASARKYLRCMLNDEPHIIMDTTPGQEQINFVKIANLLATNNINAPKIIDANFERGLILMNDFGDNTYLSVLKKSDPENVHQLYLAAIKSLVKMQLIAKRGTDLPQMDVEYIDNRLQVFSTWYVQKHLNLGLNDQTENLLADLNKLFVTAFNELPQVFVHVDYHCRNLMHIATANTPGVLDFQDAMFGPMTYDLVSLFQDAYITWPRSQVENWIKIYHDLAVDAGVLEPQDFNVLMRNFDLVGLQRHIKNLGVFARLHYRDNKSGYLNSIPTLLTYISETCNRYAELAELKDYLSQHAVDLQAIDR